MSCSTSSGASPDVRALRRHAGGMDHPHARGLQRARRAARDRIGVWVRRPDKGDGHEDKIAAIGIRVRKWVTLHGIALNVEPDLSHFSGIVPCGVSEQRYGVTSLADLGLPVEHGRGRHGAAARVRAAVRADGRPDASHGRQHREQLAARAAPSSSARPSRADRCRRRGRRSEPLRQAAMMSSTAFGSPANTASTVPSRRLRTQPSTPVRAASSSTKARKPTPCTRPRNTTWRITCHRNSPILRASGAERARRATSLAAHGCRLPANPIPAPPRPQARYSRASAALRAPGRAK